VTLRISVDFASGTIDDIRVREVIGQFLIVCGKRPSAAYNRQGQNVPIIGYPLPVGAQTPLFLPKLLGVGGSQSARPVQFHKLPSDFLICCELSAKPASGNKSWIPSVPEKPIDDGAGFGEKHPRRVRVNNEAHVRHPADRVPRAGKTAGTQAADW
jgi:hypothetical protein